jgi:hypothetical protein
MVRKQCWHSAGRYSWEAKAEQTGSAAEGVGAGLEEGVRKVSGEGARGGGSGGARAAAAAAPTTTLAGGEAEGVLVPRWERLGLPEEVAVPVPAAPPPPSPPPWGGEGEEEAVAWALRVELPVMVALGVEAGLG